MSRVQNVSFFIYSTFQYEINQNRVPIVIWIWEIHGTNPFISNIIAWIWYVYKYVLCKDLVRIYHNK